MRFESNRRRTALSFLLGLSMLTIIFASDTHAASPDSAPPLPAPSGNIVRVSTEPELQAAVRNLASDTTILIAPGTYHLTNTLYVGFRSLTNIALRGATNRRDDVVLVGPGMTNGNFGSAPYGIWTGAISTPTRSSSTPERRLHAVGPRSFSVALTSFAQLVVTGAMLFAINIDHRAETFLSRIRTDNAKAILQKRAETGRSLHSTCNCCARERLFSVQEIFSNRRFTHFC